MNPVDNTVDDALTGTLRQAVAQINEQPVPKAALRHVLDHLENWPEPLRLQQQRHRRFWAASTLAASIVFFIVWLAWPSDSWAQVVKAVQGKTWIRAQYEGEWGPITLWFSAERKVAANTGPHQVFFHDARLHVMYRYDPTEKTVYRLPETERDQAMTTAALSLFADIMQGKEKIQGNLMSPAKLTRQSHREVEENGTKYLEFEMEHAYPNAAPGPSITNVVRVDTQTRLPISFTVKVLMTQPAVQVTELRFAIDYPATGPLDIYDLGVARTSKYVDRIPPDDVERTVHAIKLNRETFDSYHGLLVYSNQQPFAQMWRKSMKWRIEYSKKATLLAQPVGLTDPTSWWMDQAKTVTWRASEVCDGTTIYKPDGKNFLPDEQNINNYVTQSFDRDFGLIGMERGDARHVMPEIIGYPIPQVGFQQVSVEVKPTPEKGPVDTFQLLTHFTTQRQGIAHLQRFWVDPSRSYLVMRHEIGEWDTRPEHLDWRQIERMNRTPSGIWYPQVVKGTSGTMHFYLDFKAEIPDELFTPKERVVKK
ncbi:MAG TPA: hypothetical protein PLN21_20350 [Gemmatales bacterium]|nr:hypothetical protein [Gemmatales bacterium]